MGALGSPTRADKSAAPNRRLSPAGPPSPHYRASAASSGRHRAKRQTPPLACSQNYRVARGKGARARAPALGRRWTDATLKDRKQICRPGLRTAATASGRARAPACGSEGQARSNLPPPASPHRRGRPFSGSADLAVADENPRQASVRFQPRVIHVTGSQHFNQPDILVLQGQVSTSSTAGPQADLQPACRRVLAAGSGTR